MNSPTAQAPLLDALFFSRKKHRIQLLDSPGSPNQRLLYFSQKIPNIQLSNSPGSPAQYFIFPRKAPIFNSPPPPTPLQSDSCLQSTQPCTAERWSPSSYPRVAGMLRGDARTNAQLTRMRAVTPTHAVGSSHPTPGITLPRQVASGRVYLLCICVGGFGCGQMPIPGISAPGSEGSVSVQETKIIPGSAVRGGIPSRK